MLSAHMQGTQLIVRHLSQHTRAMGQPRCRMLLLNLSCRLSLAVCM